jgi:hypothetical protein
MTTIDVSTNSDHSIIYLAVGIPQGIIWVDEQPEEESLGNVRNGRTTVHFPLDSFEYWIRALDGVTVDTLLEVAAKQDDLDDFADNLAFMDRYSKGYRAISRSAHHSNRYRRG